MCVCVCEWVAGRGRGGRVNFLSKEVDPLRQIVSFKNRMCVCACVCVCVDVCVCVKGETFSKHEITKIKAGSHVTFCTCIRIEG